MTRRAGALRAVTVPVVLAVCVLGAIPSSASAATDPVGVGVARTLPDEHGSFRVPVWTDAAGATVQHVTATVRDGSTSVDTLTLVDGGSGFWSPSAPLSLTGDGGTVPHLGHYAIDVTAGDDHGDTTTRTDAGVLDFTLVPEFAGQGTTASGATRALSFSPATLTHDDHAVSVSGVLLGRRPGSGGLSPLGGQPVSVVQRDVLDGAETESRVQVTTDADGRFATTPLTPSGYPSYVVQVGIDTAQTHGTVQALESPQLSSAFVTVTAHVTPARVSPGQRLTISGVVRSGTSPSSPAIAGALVRVRLSSNPAADVLATTSGSGTFSASIVAVAGHGPGTAPGTGVGWGVTPVGPYFVGAEADGSVLIPWESTLRSVSITLASDGRVSAHGALDATYPPRYGSVSNDIVQLQYSPDGRTGWRTLASSRATPAALTARGYLAGWYRLLHPVSDALDTVASPAVHRSRINTRVSGNNAGPEPVAKGRTVTVTGTFQQDVHGWRPLPGATVLLYFRPTGSKTWTPRSEGTTDAHGHARLHATATVSGDWLLQYFGDATHFDSDGTPDTVRVR